MAAVPVGGEGLFVAAAAGDIRQIEQLLAAGADVNSLNAQGHSCLRLACEKGHEACALFLLPRLSAERLRAEADACLLECSCRGWTGAVRQLLAGGANVNAKTRYERTALHCACCAGHLDVVRVLVEAGADLNSAANERETPLCTACCAGRKDIAFYLLDKGADPTVGDRSALGEACVRGCTAIMRKVLEMFPSEAVGGHLRRGLSLLHSAALGGKIEITNLLLAYGADINARGNSGETPLMMLAQCYYDFNDGWKRTMHALLGAGSRVDDACYDRGFTALHYALQREDPRFRVGEFGHNGAVDILLERGASVNTKGNSGVTPLHTVCMMGAAARAIQLLKHGASVNAEDNDGLTPLVLACVGYTDVPGIGTRAMSIGQVGTIRALIGRGADFGTSSPGSNLVADGRDAEMRRLALETCACRALLQAYEPQSQPLVAPRALRWLARRLETGVPGVSTVTLSDLHTEGGSRASKKQAPVRDLKLKPLRDDAWKRRKHVVVCRALIRMRRKELMDRAHAGAGSAGSALSEK